MAHLREPQGEVAALPPSQITKLAMWLLASGVYTLNASKGDPKRAKALVAQLTPKLSPAQLTREYGIRARWIQLYDSPQIAQSFVADIRKAITKNVVPDPDVTQEELTFVRWAALFASNPGKDPKYLQKAQQFAAKVGTNFLRVFSSVIDAGEADEDGVSNDVSAMYTELSDLVGQLTNKKANARVFTVPAAELKTLKLKSVNHAALALRYNRLRRKLSVRYDLDFANYIGKQKGPVPLHTAYAHMKKMGYKSQKLPEVTKSIPLNVGVDSGKIKYYTETGKPLSAGLPGTAIDITFARTYREATGTGAYLSYTTPEALGITRVYTEQHAKAAVASKFDKADKVNENIDKVLVQWKRDLASSDKMKMMASTAAMLVYLTGMRVGSRQNSAASASGVMTYGTISLRPRHVKITGTSIILSYPGKKSVLQKHTIPLKGTPEKAVAKNLAALLAGKAKEDLVFSLAQRGKPKPLTLTYGEFTGYLKASGYPSGIHKLRHVRGTNLVIELLEKHKWSPSSKSNTLVKKQKDAEDWVVATILTPAAKLLGHKSGDDKTLWRTTVKSYLNPAPIAAWFVENGLRRPKWLPAKVEAE